MTRYRHLILAVLVLLCAGQSKAWNCPTGQHNVQVPDGTTSGTIHVIEGETFQCQPDVPPSTPGNTTVKAKSSSNSSSTSASNSSSTASANQQQQQNQSQTANGGTAANNSSGNQTTYNSESEYKEIRQNPGLNVPEVLTVNNCGLGGSGGASTPAFSAALGLTRVDKGCDDVRTANAFLAMRNRVAAATVLCNSPAAKRSHLKLETCLLSVPEVAPVYITAPAPRVESKQPINVNVTIQAPAAPSVAAAAVAIAKVEAPAKPAGSCVVIGRVDNVCARVLDDNVKRLNADGGARLVVTGKQLNVLAVRAYVTSSKHGVWIDPDRILLNVNDEPSATVVFGIIPGTQPTVQ